LAIDCKIIAVLFYHAAMTIQSMDLIIKLVFSQAKYIYYITQQFKKVTNNTKGEK